MLNILYKTHTDTWIVTILLFIISYIFLKASKDRAQKISHMLLRLIFLAMLVSGFALVINHSFSLISILKTLAGIWLIASMEMILVKGRKGDSTTAFWIQLILSLVAVLVIAFRFI